MFMAAKFDAQPAHELGQDAGDSTPIMATIPTDDPWVPLRILGLGLDAEQRVEADVFLLTDRRAGAAGRRSRPQRRAQRAGVGLAARRPAIRRRHGVGAVLDVAVVPADRRRRPATSTTTSPVGRPGSASRPSPTPASVRRAVVRCAPAGDGRRGGDRGRCRSRPGVLDRLDRHGRPPRPADAGRTVNARRALGRRARVGGRRRPGAASPAAPTSRRPCARPGAGHRRRRRRAQPFQTLHAAGRGGTRSASWSATPTRSTTSSSSAHPRSTPATETAPSQAPADARRDVRRSRRAGRHDDTFDDPGTCRDRVPPARPLRLRHARRGRGRRAPDHICAVSEYHFPRPPRPAQSRPRACRARIGSQGQPMPTLPHLGRPPLPAQRSSPSVRCCLRSNRQRIVQRLSDIGGEVKDGPGSWCSR